ncbi:hypothetical protein [Streptomyces sp. NBC_01431]|uniref:hypothetical protein n=1 Tax=Streptomyces sp. NBC_01431 TaxID=2903863 RepID=UPI002E36243B|nr:hypothetical protein [Streptomyces sp. NBC_01431]
MRSFAVAGQIERNYIREETLEGQVSAAKKGNHGGRLKVIDDNMLTFALARSRSFARGRRGPGRAQAKAVAARSP